MSEVKMSDTQFNTLMKTISRDKEDHDLLVEIRMDLKNHIENDKEKSERYDEHIRESVPIRDTVKDNSGKVKFLLALGWLILAVNITQIIRLIYIMIEKRVI